MKPTTWNWVAAGIFICGLICLPCAADMSFHAAGAGNGDSASTHPVYGGMLQNDAQQNGKMFNRTPGGGMGLGMAPPDGMNWTPGNGMKANWTPPDGMKCNGTPPDGMRANWTPLDGMNWTPGNGMRWNGTPPDGMNWTPGDGMRWNGTPPERVLLGNRSENHGILSGLTGFMTNLLL